jgi:alpha-tubulin suppressor-like RCC1 family protein
MITTEIKSKPSALSSCGRGLHGRLGNNTETDQNVFQQVKLGGSMNVRMATAGHWHGALLTDDGHVYFWGYNKAHVLVDLPDIVLSPTHVPLGSVVIDSISCGFNYTVAISREGDVYSWGCGRSGALGQGDKLDRGKPTLVKLPEKMTMVNAGYCHSAFISTSGCLYTCGKGKDGALGHGSYDDKLMPCLVESLSKTAVAVRDVSCSQGEHHSHTLAVSEDGNVLSCGDGYKGKLGHGNYDSCNIFVMIDPVHFNRFKVTSVACGGIHSIAMVTGEGVFTWGCGSDGRLGHPEAHGHRYLYHCTVPHRVEGLTDWKPIQISTSYYHTAVLCHK